jgi:hypothetical protein
MQYRVDIFFLPFQLMGCLLLVLFILRLPGLPCALLVGL